MGLVSGRRARSPSPAPRAPAGSRSSSRARRRRSCPRNAPGLSRDGGDAAAGELAEHDRTQRRARRARPRSSAASPRVQVARASGLPALAAIARPAAIIDGSASTSVKLPIAGQTLAAAHDATPGPAPRSRTEAGVQSGRRARTRGTGRRPWRRRSPARGSRDRQRRRRASRRHATQPRPRPGRRPRDGRRRLPVASGRSPRAAPRSPANAIGKSRAAGRRERRLVHPTRVVALPRRAHPGQ